LKYESIIGRLIVTSFNIQPPIFSFWGLADKDVKTNPFLAN